MVVNSRSHDYLYNYGEDEKVRVKSTRKAAAWTGPISGVKWVFALFGNFSTCQSSSDSDVADVRVPLGPESYPSSSGGHE